MTPLASLWLAILVAAVFVFVVSSVVHMVVQWHKPDYWRLPDEDRTLEMLRSGGVGAGQYMFPHCESMSDFAKPEVKAKFERGPIGTLIVRDPKSVNMGKALGQWFVFCLVVGVLVAYVTGIAKAPGEPGVFRVAATTALLGYGFSSVTDSIWKGIAWSTTAKYLVDGVLYALATGAAFAWLWPSAV